MSTPTNTIGINGEQYNTIGSVINTANPSGKNKQVIDGFVKASVKTSVRTASSLNPVINVNKLRDQVKATQFHNRAQRAQTLVRGGLKKPSSYFQSNLQPISNSSRIERELRAKQTPKHSRIEHFGVPTVKKTQATSSKAMGGEIINADHQAHSPTKAAPAPLPSMITSVSHQKLERLLDQALTRADAHKNALHYQAARSFWKRKSGRNRSVLVLAGLLVIGVGLVLAWQKVPQLSIKVAGIKAHVSPAVPAYKPEGYMMAGPAKAVQGAVTLQYAKNNSSQSYNITQSPSNFNSSLVSQNIVPKGANVQTSQVQGNTVYIYGQNNDAAWVNNGVLYTLKDKANLSSDQIIKIVQGLNP